VNTHVPKNVLQSDPLFPPFPVNINLFTEIPGIDRTFSENTVMKIYYSKDVDNFISDLYYNDARIKPDEAYPPEMAAKIDSIVKEQARLLAEQEAAAGQARLSALQAEKDLQIKITA
jgi:hypothetical protein